MNKKQKRRKNRKRQLKIRTLFALIIFFTISFIILSNYTEPTKANYISNIEIDSERTESAYELIIDETDYDVWFANSEERHFLYLDFNYQINETSKQIYTDDFNYDISAVSIQTSFLESYCLNNTLELSIERCLVENEFTISVDTLNILIEITPSTISTPSETTKGEEEEKTRVIRSTPFKDLENAYKENPLLAIFHTVLVCTLLSVFIFGTLYMRNRCVEYPIHYVENAISEKEWKELLPKEPKKKNRIQTKKKESLKDGEIDKRYLQEEGFNIKEKFLKLGRLIQEIGGSKATGKNILLYKSGRKFLLEIHCDDHLDQVKGSTQKKIYMFYTILRKYTLRTLEIPKDKQTYKYIRKRGFKNAILFFIARRLPKDIGLSLKNKIYNSVHEKSDELNKKVLYLQHEDQRERLKITADFKYQKRIPDASDPNRYEEKSEKELPLFMREIYENDPDIRDFIDENGEYKKDENGEKIKVLISNQKERIIEIDPLYRSRFREHEDNLRSELHFLKAMLLEKMEEYSDYINKLEMEKAEAQAEFTTKLGKAIANIQKAKQIPVPKFAETYFRNFMSKGDQKKAYEEAIKQLEIDQKYNELKRRIEELDDPLLFDKMKEEIKRLKKKIVLLEEGNGDAYKALTKELEQRGISNLSEDEL